MNRKRDRVANGVERQWWAFRSQKKETKAARERGRSRDEDGDLEGRKTLEILTRQVSPLERGGKDNAGCIGQDFRGLVSGVWGDSKGAIFGFSRNLSRHEGALRADTQPQRPPSFRRKVAMHTDRSHARVRPSVFDASPSRNLHSTTTAGHLFFFLCALQFGREKAAAQRKEFWKTRLKSNCRDPSLEGNSTPVQAAEKGGQRYDKDKKEKKEKKEKKRAGQRREKKREGKAKRGEKERSRDRAKMRKKKRRKQRARIGRQKQRERQRESSWQRSLPLCIGHQREAATSKSRLGLPTPSLSQSVALFRCSSLHPHSPFSCLCFRLASSIRFLLLFFLASFQLRPAFLSRFLPAGSVAPRLGASMQSPTVAAGEDAVETKSLHWSREKTQAGSRREEPLFLTFHGVSQDATRALLCAVGTPDVQQGFLFDSALGKHSEAEGLLAASSEDHSALEERSHEREKELKKLIGETLNVDEMLETLNDVKRSTDKCESLAASAPRIPRTPQERKKEKICNPRTEAKRKRHGPREVSTLRRTPVQKRTMPLSLRLQEYTVTVRISIHIPVSI
ncbi:hypothetical protein TGFOU_285770A [Toxoplasma gondii FOU]|uniref:Uncharacterized protein n=1 Tax=Toxoplasma gondii FOU TaxID=943167 RepID=A0A086LDL3_TOXGO|nr:hypothetical protein TGFOU_285770A [Toxoplasma gondii FOU]